jgi:predicted dehydrogenase
MMSSISIQPLRFALIGAGGIAQTHLQAISKSDMAELVAVVDTRLDACRAVSDAYGCSAFGSIDSMLQTCHCDAALVCTPPSTHPAICEQLASNGIHVLCEKPIAIDLKSAISMFERARASKTILAMASKFRYVADMVFAKQLITSGLIGDVLLFENTFAGHVDMTRRWNSNPEISGGGVLIDNGTHSVDILRYLLGPLVSIQAIEGIRHQRIPVEDTVRIHAKTDTGALAAMDLSWSINKQSPWWVSIYGTCGTILIGWKESKYKRDVDREWTTIGTGYDKLQAFKSQLDNFCLAIRGEEPLLITSEDALASVEAIHGAYESMTHHNWVQVNAYPSRTLRVVS